MCGCIVVNTTLVPSGDQAVCAWYASKSKLPACRTLEPVPSVLIFQIDPVWLTVWLKTISVPSGDQSGDSESPSARENTGVKPVPSGWALQIASASKAVLG